MKLLNDKRLCSEIGQNARVKVEQLFDIEKNVELMEQNISPQNIHDVDKPLKKSTVNRVKLLEQPKIDIKMPKSVQSEKDKNIKSVFVEEDLKQPKFVFDRTNKLSNLSSDKKNKSSFFPSILNSEE